MDGRSAAWSLIALSAFGVAELASAKVVESEKPERRDESRVGIGARAAWVPEFPGSDSGEMLVLPAFDISYGRLFVNADGLGVRLMDRNG